MNEKILELYKQAGAEFSLKTGASYANFNPEKFAKLLARECSNLIIQEGGKIADAMPKADRTNYTVVAEQTGMINAALRYSDVIKQYFDIKHNSVISQQNNK